MTTIHAKARVQVTVEVSIGQPWGDACTVGQVYKQAKEHAIQSVRNVLKSEASQMRITGEPKVIGVFTEGE